MTTTIKLDHAVRSMALERVHFFDGMILTADDLEAERHYHLTRSRMINRAVFGCGIACGLEVKRHSAEDAATRFVCIHPGTAFDCQGDPLELCRPVKLDLDPDPCKAPPARVCILIRRRDGKPQSSDPCSCGKPAGDEPRRLREQVEIRVVDPASGLEGVCWTPPKQSPSYDAGDCDDHEPEGQPEHDPCACLKECESCTACGEDWILLACVDLRPPKGDEDCPGPDRDRWYIDEVDDTGRKYIKPIRCHCPPESPEHPKDEPEDSKYSEDPKHHEDPKAPRGAKGGTPRHPNYADPKRPRNDPKRQPR
jgi:hypothetical protein